MNEFILKYESQIGGVISGVRDMEVASGEFSSFVA